MMARFQRETPVLKYALFCRSAQIAGLQHKILDAEQGKHYVILFVFFCVYYGRRLRYNLKRVCRHLLKIGYIFGLR